MRTKMTAALGMVLALALAGCGGGKQTAATSTNTGGEITCEYGEGSLALATGNSTSAYYLLGGGIANTVTDASGGKLKMTAAETGASVQNIQQLVAGDFDVAMTLADTAADAVNGAAAFEGEPADIQAIARLYANYTELVVRKDAGITKVEDLKGKVVSTGSPKSGTEVVSTRLLETAGLNIDSDLSAQRLDLAKSVDGMKDGSIDALIFAGGLPTPALTDLFVSQPGVFDVVDLSSYLTDMQEINAAYTAGTIPAGTYEGSSEVSTIVVPSLLVVRGDFDPNTGCAMAKTLVEQNAELAKVHPSGAEITAEDAPKVEPLTLNAGAQKAYDEMQ